MNTDTAYWNIKINKKWTINSIIILMVCIFILAIIITPPEPKTNRIVFGELLISAVVPAKLAISDSVESNPIGAPIKLEGSSFLKIGPYGNLKTVEGYQVYIEKFEINSKGVITLLASGLPVSVELTPIINGNKIDKWQCVGRPNELTRHLCH